MSILQTTELKKYYGAEPNITRALDGVTLSIEKGEFVAIVGTSGSGKSTLIKLAMGLLQPTSGELLIDGKAPSPQTNAIVSYLPDRVTLSPWMKTRQLLDFYCDFYADFDRQAAERMLTHLGLNLNQSIRQMSKGMKEKVQLVLTMSRKAKLYLLDEPIGGVDPATRDYILHTIISNYNPEAAVIISTHLIADVEPVLDDVIFLDHGHIALHESCEEIRETRGQSVDALFREVFKCWEN